jgi:hypothetical protein
MKPGKPRKLILGSCPRCMSTDFVRLGKWDKAGVYKGTQRLRCNTCKYLFPEVDLKPPNQFVFRPCEMNFFYEAYLPGNLRTPVMTGINKYGKQWGWNCWDIGLFNSRTELVKHYLVVKDQYQ